jgi:hypothetical protein
VSYAALSRLRKRRSASVGPAATSFLDPRGDRRRVGPGHTAQPGSLPLDRLAKLTFGRALEDAGDLGQQVGAAARELALGHCGGSLRAGNPPAAAQAVDEIYSQVRAAILASRPALRSALPVKRTRVSRSWSWRTVRRNSKRSSFSSMQIQDRQLSLRERAQEMEFELRRLALDRADENEKAANQRLERADTTRLRAVWCASS